MFSLLQKQKKEDIRNKDTIQAIFSNEAFSSFQNINLLPLIYDEKKQKMQYIGI